MDCDSYLGNNLPQHIRLNGFSIMSNEEEKETSKIAVLLAALAGVGFSVGAIFINIALESVGGGTAGFNIISGGQWTVLLSSLPFWIAMLGNGAGLGFWFWALTEGRVAVVGPFMSGFMMLIPAIVGLTFWGETLSLTKIVGIIGIVVGAMGLSRKA